jgi:hypothetical protein
MKAACQPVWLHSRPVFTARSHRRLTAWLALVAMLAFALVPTVSRAMAFAGGNSNWAEVCTPQGVKLVSTGDAFAGEADRETAPRPAAHTDACSFCSMLGDGTAPLPAAPTATPLPLAGAEPPRLLLQATAPQPAWRSAPARAPPVRS